MHTGFPGLLERFHFFTAAELRDETAREKGKMPTFRNQAPLLDEKELAGIQKGPAKGRQTEFGQKRPTVLDFFSGGGPGKDNFPGGIYQPGVPFGGPISEGRLPVGQKAYKKWSLVKKQDSGFPENSPMETNPLNRDTHTVPLYLISS